MDAGVFDGVPDDVVQRFGLDRMPPGGSDVPAAELLRLDGRVALVTGGGGDGLGNAICHRLAEQGAAVAVLDRDLDAASTTVRELAGRRHARALAVRADVTDPDACRAAHRQVTEGLGMVDLLVNNAGGGYGTVGTRFADLAHDDMLAVVGLNFLGVLTMTRTVLPDMLAQRRGCVVTVASEGGLVGSEGIVTYSACKAGVVHFTRSLSREVGHRGVRVVSVSPGMVLSTRNVDRMRDADPAALAPLAAGLDRTGLGRPSMPDEVAVTVAFLCSPAAGYVHGTNLSVGGGLSA